MSSVSESARLLDILIPNGGDLVTVSEAYFDESYEDNSPRVMCVAGYVFRKSKAQEFGRVWGAYLRGKGLPYFHANECAHRDGVFKGWTDAECDVVSRKLIALAKEYSDYGVAVAVDRDEYANVCKGHIMFPTAYAYVFTNCLYRIAHWRETAKRSASTSYFLEQGHAHANDANQFLTFMLKGNELSGRLGYYAHGFLPKVTPQLHPGDLLSWLFRLHAMRVMTKDPRPMRKDLEALMRPQDDFIIYQRQNLEYFRDTILRHAPAAEAYVREIALHVGLSPDAAEYAAKWQPDYRRPGR